MAEALREAARSELGLVVSVGVAPNRLLAKLASRRAKPDGMWAVARQVGVRLTGCQGGGAAGRAKPDDGVWMVGRQVRCVGPKGCVGSGAAGRVEGDGMWALGQQVRESKLGLWEGKGGVMSLEGGWETQ